MVRAGAPAVAAALRDGKIGTRFGSYRDLYDPPEEAQGVARENLGQDEVDIIAELLEEMINGDVERRSDPKVQATLARALEQVRSAPESQGVLGPVRRLVNAATTLVSAQPLRKLGRWTSGRAMIYDLSQVARYLSRTEMTSGGISLDERIRGRVLSELGSGPVLVIAHSLGSVVAFETLHEFIGLVPMWITIGSPLGMRTAVLPRLVPRPPVTPDCVREWRNFWDGDDVISVRGTLEDDFGPNSSGVRARSEQLRSRALWAHDATRYLRTEEVAAAAVTVLS
jgi:hypothetical protein